MEEIRKSDAVAFCHAKKIELYEQLSKLDNNTFLSVREQKSLVLNLFEACNIIERLACQNEANKASLAEIQKFITSVQSVEKMIENSIYRFTEKWK